VARFGPWRPGVYEPFDPPPAAGTAAPEPPASGEPAPRPPAPRLGEGPEAAPQDPAVARYVIQVAAFSDADAAADLVRILRRRYPEYPARVVARSGLHRVWLGGWADRAAAESVLVIVRHRYPDAWIATP
jgi:cell division septation protein DedD